jgi:hypothetical protein
MKRVVAAVFFLLSILTSVLIPSSPCFGEKWAFVAIGDNRSAFSSYRNVLEEIRDRKVNPEPRFPPADFVLGCGDIGPMADNYEIYESVFKGDGPFYFPVRGNHERRADVRFMLDRLLMPFRDRMQLRSTQAINYYTDWKNVRLIVLDQYSDFNDTLSNKPALQWVDNAIRSAADATHVFVAFHEPVTAGDPPTGKFWRVLLGHKGKVRAVFVGHLHFHYRMKIPNEPGGIDYINVGNAGQTSHSDRKQTIVSVMVDDGKVTYRVIQAPDGTRDFKLREQWYYPKRDASVIRSWKSPEKSDPAVSNDGQVK